MSVSTSLRVTLVQPVLHWEQPSINRGLLEKLLALHHSPTDIIVFPEMFTTGFSMNTLLAEERASETLSWMQRVAKNYDAVVTGSVMTAERGGHFNRLLWVRPDGTYETYDKRHLFSFAGEDRVFTPGNERLIVEHLGWRICPLICYDLRFPVWSRNTALKGTKVDSAFDLLLYVANWPEARKAAWTCLLEARAHENQCYVAGLNRVGTDGNGIVYSGDSVIHGPKGGTPLLRLKQGEQGVGTVAMSYADLSEYRTKFGAWKDKDAFEIKG